jgi:hypothetical protein
MEGQTIIWATNFRRIEWQPQLDNASVKKKTSAEKVHALIDRQGQDPSQTPRSPVDPVVGTTCQGPDHPRDYRT